MEQSLLWGVTFIIWWVLYFNSYIIFIKMALFVMTFLLTSRHSKCKSTCLAHQARSGCLKPEISLNLLIGIHLSYSFIVMFVHYLKGIYNLCYILKFSSQEKYINSIFCKCWLVHYYSSKFHTTFRDSEVWRETPQTVLFIFSQELCIYFL
jgi:hypothetical protein